MKIALISCTKRKLQKPTKAKTLYSASTLFVKAWSYCSTHYDQCYILSAKHGLLDPELEIGPYDETLNHMSKKERLEWASMVVEDLLKIVSCGDEVYFHAGTRYREFLIEPLNRAGVISVVPLKGLGIGQQLRWYSNQM